MRVCACMYGCVRVYVRTRACTVLVFFVRFRHHYQSAPHAARSIGIFDIVMEVTGAEKFHFHNPADDKH